MKVEEIRIPAPWGHIAAKAWGDHENDIIIVSHGYMDNAGSFDRLIPILPTNYYYVCLDLPGHGFSTCFYEHLPSHYTNFILPYKVIIEFFKRSKYILMGHSFGAQMSLFFAQLYPHFVKKVIMLDALYPVPMGSVFNLQMIIAAHDYHLIVKDVSDRTLTTMTYDDAIDKVQRGRFVGKLTKEAAEDLTKRMIKKDDNGMYIFTNDPKLRNLIMPSATHRYNKELFIRRPVKCPVLILLAPDNNYTAWNYKLRQFFKEIGFQIKEIQGHHHVHQTNPAEMASEIIKFLSNMKLWGEQDLDGVIVLHGYLDNAGSFDRLIPRMPKNFCYICVDLPGHGLSSSFDPSLPVHYINYLIAIRIVVEHFKKDKYVMMGHSFGATLCMYYGQLYPNNVIKVIMLDALYTIPSDPGMFMSNLAYAHKLYFEKWSPENKNQKAYPYEEILEKIKSARYPGAEGDGPAHDIAKRMTRETNGRYIITTDPQLKALILPSSTFDFNVKLLKKRPVLCPKLFLLTKENTFNITNKPIYEFYKSQGYDVRHIEGEHHVHQTKPEVVLEHIVPFLLNQNAKY